MLYGSMYLYHVGFCCELSGDSTVSQMCGLYSKNWERIALEDSIFLLVVMRKAVCIMGKILLDKINLQIHSIGKVTKIKRGVGKLIF